MRAIAEGGLTPLEYLMSIVRDEAATQEVRIDAAAKAAPYVHPRLAATDMNMTNFQQKTVEEKTEEELIARIAYFEEQTKHEDPEEWAKQQKFMREFRRGGT